MRLGKHRLTTRQVDGSALAVDRVVLGKALRPAAAHLVPALSLGNDVHLRIDKHGHRSTLTPRTTEGISTIDATAFARDGAVLKHPSDVLRRRRHSSIAAGYLQQFEVLEVGVALAAEVVRTTAHLSVFEVIQTVLVVRCPRILIAVEQRVLVDSLRGLVVNGEVTSQGIVDTTLDGDVLEVDARGATLQLQHGAIAYRLVLVRRSELSVEDHVGIVADVLRDDGSIAVFTDERDVGSLDIRDGVWQVAFPIRGGTVAAGMLVVLHLAGRQLIRSLLHEDAVASGLVRTAVGSLDGSTQLLGSSHHSVVVAFSDGRTVHGGERDRHSLHIVVA